MNGMRRNKLRREQAKRFTPDGLPRDPNAWTVEDFRDLYHAIEAAKAKIAARHRRKP